MHPSAQRSASGPQMLCSSSSGETYLKKNLNNLGLSNSQQQQQAFIKYNYSGLPTNVPLRSLLSASISAASVFSV
jgi:hypothetical protein